jgi:hypothetical protein
MQISKFRNDHNNLKRNCRTLQMVSIRLIHAIKTAANNLQNGLVTRTVVQLNNLNMGLYSIFNCLQ